jgi:endonuclease YncB( thermonuclease family)
VKSARSRIASVVVLAVTVFGSWPAVAQPKQVSGPATVVNAGLLKIGNDYIFLFGVESVVRTQECRINRVPWPCYDYAVQALANIVGTDTVTCSQVGPPADYLGRWLGMCTVGGESVNLAFVKTGFGLAKRNETMDYVAAEAAAKAAGIGLWQSQFQMPADFRKSENIGIDRP